MRQSAGSAQKQGSGRPVWLVSFGTLLLFLPVVANGYPLVFFDTPAYLAGGEGVLSRLGLVERPTQAAPPQAEKQTTTAGGSEKKATRFSDARSIYYGLIAEISRRIGGLYLTAIVQALWVATAIVLAMRHTGPRRTKVQFATLAAVALLGGAAFGTSMILPDMAGGVLLLGFGMVAGYAARLNRGEWLFWLLSIVAAISFHKAFFLVAVALFVASGLIPGRPLWRGRAGLLMGGTLIFSALLTFGAERAVERVTGASMPHVPFLLGRVVEDGTATPLLQKECPGMRWATCAMLPGMPMTASDFLWDGVDRNGLHISGWNQLSVEDRARISAESKEIVRRTVMNDPWAQLRATVWNVVDQFLSAGVTRYDQNMRVASALRQPMPGEAARVEAGRFYNRPIYLRIASAIMIFFALSSSALLLVACIQSWRAGRFGALPTFGAVILLGAALNAAINGALAVVVDRYQGRLAWTLVFSALALGFAYLSTRRRTDAREEISVATATTEA